MIIIVRRVLSASVWVDQQQISTINQGLLLYVGIGVDDTKEECDFLAKKVANLRIFDFKDSSEVSVQDINGEILSVSQFTLYADTKKGNRPSYINAMKSELAKGLFDYFNESLRRESAIEIQTGVFGADMQIQALDDGPFTIILTKNK